MEKVSSIEVRGLDAVQHPKMIDYGQMIDCCQDFSYCFSASKTYGIIGECGSGGWALSYTLTGREKATNGEVLINGKQIDSKDLQKYSCYVGEGISSGGLAVGKNSVLKQLQAGIKISGRRDYSVEDIITLFGLSKDRLNYEVEELSWERWRASIAIGFAYEKSVYCFPWCSTNWVNDLILNSGIHRCFDILKQDVAIILLPTGNQKGVEYFADEIVHINNSRSLPSQRAMKVVEDIDGNHVLLAVRVSGKGVYFARTLFVMSDEKIGKYREKKALLPYNLE